jgi:hypothetical protein
VVLLFDRYFLVFAGSTYFLLLGLWDLSEGIFGHLDQFDDTKHLFPVSRFSGLLNIEPVVAYFSQLSGKDRIIFIFEPFWPASSVADQSTPDRFRLPTTSSTSCVLHTTLYVTYVQS